MGLTLGVVTGRCWWGIWCKQDSERGASNRGSCCSLFGSCSGGPVGWAGGPGFGSGRGATNRGRGWFFGPGCAWSGWVGGAGFPKGEAVVGRWILRVLKVSQEGSHGGGQRLWLFVSAVRSSF